MNRNQCLHKNLFLLPVQTDRIRCRHCALTIKSSELNGRYCPECYETTGKKRYDFEEVAEETDGSVQYRCEDCGVLIQLE